MTPRSSPRVVSVALVLLLAACDQARQARQAASAGGCTGCHGGLDNQTGAPPNDLHGQAASAAVGAHTRHLAAGVACGSCHLVPSRFGSAGHGDGVVQVTFGGTAVAGGAAPAWDRASATCSNVYCHGATFTGASAGASPSPAWTGTLAGGACGACHSTRPRGHGAFAQTDCARCHPGTVSASGALIAKADGGQHLDGLRQVVFSATACTGCHGGTDNGSGAPPRDLAGRTATTEVTVGAHTAHLAAGLTCAACHPVPAADAPASHIGGGTAQIAWGPLAGTGGATPAWNRGPATCSNTYCHGGFTGGNALAPVWTKVGSGQAACGTCHGQVDAALPGLPVRNHPALAAGAAPDVCNACHPGTVDAAGKPLAATHLGGTLQLDDFSRHPAGFIGTPHQIAATAGVQRCLGCHAAKGAAKVTTVVCGSCHDGLAKGADWTTACNTCHGSAQTAAPPPWTTKNHPAQAGGAHLAHVLATSQLAAPLGCEFCHQKPATVLSAGHLDGAIHVTGYTGTDATWSAAVKEPGWSATTSSCATAYCHGAFTGGKATNLPVWTSVGLGQAACGTCHELPPPAPHPTLSSSGLGSCSACHPDTVTASGALVPPASGGKHLNGVVDVSGGHLPSWMDPASPGFHAVSAIAGLDGCKNCHGADLSGGFAKVSCATCHGAAWRTACTMCHGGINDQSGAPPKATWGRAADAVRTGAHDAHVRGGSINPGGFDCSVCHVKPADAFAAGHIDGPTATVVFSGLALPATAWDRATPTCAVYCHGATVSGGTQKTPTWTSVGQSQAACGTCHGAPPAAPHPNILGGPSSCNPCHPKTIDSSGNVIAAKAGGLHINGSVEVASGHGADWMNQSSAGFHGAAVFGGLGSCQFCHGLRLDGAGGRTTVGCQDCHGPSWSTNCTMCHGGTDNQTGAPPRTTWGNVPDPVRVGAHSAHLAGGRGWSAPVGCVDCHSMPLDAFSTGHIDGTASVSGYTGLDPLLQAALGNPGWSRASATCATAYCHGATLQGGANPSPRWTGGAAEVSCQSCHGYPPPTGTDAYPGAHHDHVVLMRLGCGTCHLREAQVGGKASPFVDPSYHMNGKKDVVNWTGRVLVGWDCNGCHQDRIYE